MPVIVDLTGDASKLQRAYDVAEKSDKSLRDSLAGTGKVGQSAAESIEREFNKAGDKSGRAFNTMIRELRKTGPEGKQVAEEVERHLRDTGKAGRQSMDSIVQRLGELDPEAAAAANAMRKHISENAEVVEAKLVEMESPLAQFKRKAQEAFGAEGVKSVSSYTKALGGAAVALKLMGDNWSLIREKQDAAFSSLEEQADPEKRLAQVATSGKDLDALIAKADILSVQYGLDRRESRNLMFSARSEGFEKDASQIAKFGQVVDVGSQGALAGKLGRLFEGEGLDVRQRLSGVLAAASKSAFDFETVGESVKKSAAASKGAGADLAETLAANATLANSIGESAGDRIKAFGSRLSNNKQFGGRGIIAGVEALAAAPEEDRRKFLGDSQELNEAFRLLSEQMPALKEMTTAVRKDIAASGRGGGMLQEKLSTVEGSVRFQQRESVRRSEIAKEIAEEGRYSGDAAMFKAAENLLEADIAERGVSSSMQNVLTKWRPSDIPILGNIIPEGSLSDAAIFAGSKAGLSSDTVSGVFGSTMSSFEPLAAKSWAQTGAKFLANLDPSGASRLRHQSLEMQMGGGGTTGRILSLLERSVTAQEKALSAQEQTAEASRATAANTGKPDPPPNYSAGLQSEAASPSTSMR